MRLRWIPVLLCLTTSIASARRAGDPLRPGFNMFSKDQDVQLGQENAQEVLKQYEVVQNQSLQDYVRRLGDRLAGTVEARQSGFKFTFTLLNVQQINAFALPGGPMFIYTGIFKPADNEGQLAGVMAHEMSHVILRHGTHEASKANLIKLPLALAGAASGGSLLGQVAQMGLGLTANSFILKFSRDAESEADALGSHLMSEAGYNPIEMARFFEKLAASGGQGPQFLSDHPNPGNRERAIEQEIRTLPQRQYGSDSGDFARVKSQIAALPAPKKLPASGN
jgi:beta-barrel assembly-enhancing protease